MRLIRLLGAVIIFYGLTYLLHGQIQLFMRMRYATVSSRTSFIIMLNMLIGVSTVVLGIGLLMAKAWARVTWLVIAPLLLALHLSILLFFYATGTDVTQQLINVFLTSMLVVISWLKLTKEPVKKHFT